MDYHDVIEAAGIVIIGLVVYSYICRWFAPVGRLAWRWRVVVTGLVFGGLSVTLMIARIHVGDGVYLDARAIPLALVGLFEGGPAVAIAAIVAGSYRLSLGGAGAVAGTSAIAAIAVVAWLAHRWARRDGRVKTVHALMLAVAVFLITFGSFAVLGRRGLALFEPLWFPFLLTVLVGVGLVARLFVDVADSQAAELARREAAELRAATLLARATAHEINNPLNIVIGGLALVARRHPAGGDDAEWIARATASAKQIQDIVARMSSITRLRTTEGKGMAPPMLDVRKSSADTPDGPPIG